ncbi:MAG TPA: hypothetical protein VM487_09365 [Phycisphaerae bacterium]|nr:hypothetical protein [Phycisphaerae bacterium]
MGSGTPGYFEYRAIDPRDPGGPPVMVRFARDLITWYYENRSVDYENFRCVRHVLDHTERIFRGVRDYEEGELSWWCYTGHPKEWCIKENVFAPFPGRSLVFAVYLNPKFELYTFRAERADPQQRACPINWRSRYGELLWPKSIS